MKDELRKIRCAVIGHQPHMLRQDEDEVRVALEVSILKAVSDGYTSFISGLSSGVGMWAAEIVVRLKKSNPNLHLIAAIPFAGFDEEWEEEARLRYRFLLSQAEYVKVMEPARSKEAYQVRNEWLVNHSARLIAVHNGQPGSTGNTILYARQCRRQVFVIAG